MALTIELYEHSGALIGTPPAPSELEVDNLGWKDSPLNETFQFPDYPLGRPFGSSLIQTSYKKYYFYKIYGTYTEALPPTVKFNATPIGQAENLVISYKWSNSYAVPDTTLLSGVSFDPAIKPTWTPLLSETGPDANDFTEVTTLINNKTYYTPYLITQLMLFPSDEDDYGNINAGLKLVFALTEKKTGLPGFEPTLVNWSP